MCSVIILFSLHQTQYTNPEKDKTDDRLASWKQQQEESKAKPKPTGQLNLDIVKYSLAIQSFQLLPYSLLLRWCSQPLPWPPEKRSSS